MSSLDNALSSPKIDVYFINIECKKERNIFLIVLYSHGPKFRPLILVHPAFGDVVLKVGILTPIEIGEGLF